MIVCDIETYPNYFLVAFKNEETGKVVKISAYGEQSRLTPKQRGMLKTIMSSHTTFGFNYLNFDVPIIVAATFRSYTVGQLKKLANQIIEDGLKWFETYNYIEVRKPDNWDVIDIMPVAPGTASLKLYEGRMHSDNLQDLPYEPNTYLTVLEASLLDRYCENDLKETLNLKNKLSEQLALREKMSKQYGLDLRSKSDAQIAEAVVKQEFNVRKNTHKPPKIIKYEPPSYIKFKTPELNEALNLIVNAEFTVGSNGRTEKNKEIEKHVINLGYSSYNVSQGGLHSKEKHRAIVTPDTHYMIDKDVTSYYPQLMVNLGVSPPALGSGFSKFIDTIKAERVAAKARYKKFGREDDLTAMDSLKIVVNAAYGKLSERFSVMYAPHLTLAVTLTGQLSLLMAIEELELAGFSVVSANTDGFTTLVEKTRKDEFEKICSDWEKRTNLALEDAYYSALYSNDVNGYLAIKTDGKTKGKKIFADPGLQKNPFGNVIQEAVREYLTTGCDIETHILTEFDIRKFLFVVTVKGGAVWRGQQLGKVARWVWTKTGEPIRYVKNNNKVGSSDGATPVMKISDYTSFNDIDYDKYINEAYRLLRNVGVNDERK